MSDDVTLLLLEHGADPGVPDSNSQTPLHVASHKGNLRVAQHQLLRFGIDVNSHDRQGQTPFQIVVEGGQNKVEKLLLDHGALAGMPLAWSMPASHQA
jgi:ankyrin repeat protein